MQLEVAIDYDDFSEWAGVFSGDNVVVSGRFNGQKCTDILRRISRITRSAIYIKNNKIISFHVVHERDQKCIKNTSKWL